MNDDLVLGTFSDFRNVKTRSVMQLVIEVPSERAEHALKLLGYPQPGAETMVAIARLKDGVGIAEAQTPEPKAIEMKGGKLAQRAGILCAERLFQIWMGDGSEDETAELLRQQCGIKSRSELDHDPKAAAVFLDMVASFYAWRGE